MEAFESVADNDGFEEVAGPDATEIVEPAFTNKGTASAAPQKEPTPAPKEATPAPKEPMPAPKEATPAPKEATPLPKEAPAPKEAANKGLILGRSEKQRRVDAARAEQLRKLKERYDVEFANIQKKRPKPKAYNAASVLSAADPEAKIKQILARDRAVYNAKQTRKGTKANEAAPKVNTNTRKRNAPSILSSTRSAATQIREKARADLKALKESAERELREIGANVSILHPVFPKAQPARVSSHKSRSRSRTRVRSLPARLNQIRPNEA